jgi:LPXTG-motif cell wall-anchored protein
MTASKRIVALLAMCLASSLALGQNADKNSAGPTRNDYRLRVVEPLEGAIIAGPAVQVTVNLEIPGQPIDEPRDVNSMPQPEVAVFLDGERRGDLKGFENVLTLDGVTPGTHNLVLLALNRSGEIIDRKEIGFESTPANGSAVAPVTAPAATRADLQAIPAASMPETEQATKSPDPIPATEARADGAEGHSLPKTGTGYPLAAGAGLVLVMTGLVLRRRA